MSSRLYSTFYASGFRSTAFNFNPKPAHPKILCHSLIELLSQVSPAFRKSFGALQKRRWAKQSIAWKPTCYMFNGDTLTHLPPLVLFLNSCGDMFVVVGCNTEFSSTLTSGSRHLSRCSLGSPVRGTTPWTVSEQRRCTQVTWAQRSTQLGRLQTWRLQMWTIMIFQ